MSTILLTGASGYVGGRLLKRLEETGARVRCLTRNPEVLAWRAHGTEIVKADLREATSLAAAFDGVHTAFYLVHSMNDGRGFEEQERKAATNFAQAARAAGVRRIIYLGGLAQGDRLSPHMRSRAETGEILRSTGIPVIELRASIVIGSGSASFEMIRSLVERLPVMITPRWVSTSAQPVAIEDVIEYLMQAIDLPVEGSLTVEIGGRDVTSYLGIMEEFARQRGLRRTIIQVPVLSLSLSSRWLTLVTPLYASIGRYLIESARHPSVVRDAEASRRFAVRPMGVREAIARALRNEGEAAAVSRWSDSGGEAQATAASGLGALVNEQRVVVAADPRQAFAPIRRIGGAKGWYFGNALWRIRGLIDLLLGGVGMRRGRPDPETPLAGTTLDFWRVEAYEPGRLLRLRAEMKVPGRAWLEFRAEETGGGTLLRQIARFEPSGPAGYAYWYLLWPVHEVMFRGMLARIAAEAMRAEEREAAAPAA